MRFRIDFYNYGLNGTMYSTDANTFQPEWYKKFIYTCFDMIPFGNTKWGGITTKDFHIETKERLKEDLQIIINRMKDYWGNF